jgi:hypothetical protein
MELTGKVIKILQMQSGTGKTGSEWRKQEFVIETPGTYPKKVALTVWNERTQDLQSLALGQEIKAYIDVESREYNEKWYTDIKAWKIEKVITGAIGSPDAGGQMPPQTPAETISNQGSNPFDAPSDLSSSQEDDLPF